MAMEGNGKTMWVVGALVVGLIAGYFVGDARGGAAAEEKYLPLIDLAYPKPPAILATLTGEIGEIYGATITLKVADPDDYLPHPDGSPQRIELRAVNVSANTTYTDVDYGTLVRGGEPTRTPFVFDNLAVGDVVTVQSAENIRDAKTIEATAIERVRY